MTEPQEQVCCDPLVSKMKILAVHGYRQCGETFWQKTGSFRKMIHKWAEFTYITAPHKVYVVEDLKKADEVNVQQSSDAEQFGWFFNRDDKTFRGTRKGGPAIGFEESIHVIEEAFDKYGPFDGIMGFSQGACFVGLLCDLQQRNMLKFKFDFAILAAGFKSGSLPHAKYYNEIITTPTLHIFGLNDEIIPKDMSSALADCFEDPVIVTHSGAHYVPASAPQKHAYQKFIKLRLLQKEHKEEDGTISR